MLQAATPRAHPIRQHDDELGVTRHGFLNLLIASAFAEPVEGLEALRILTTATA